MHIMQSRRDFFTTLSAAGAASFLGARGSLAGEGPPETTTIRLAYDPSICIAPGQISEALLRAEGFAEVQYVETLAAEEALMGGEFDFYMETAAWVVAQLAAGLPITALAGVHPGCYELFAHEPIRTISDLKGKRIGIAYTGGSGHLLLSIMAAQVGLDPHNDVEWVVPESGDAMELFAEGQVDAFLGFPPEPQELRDRKVGRVILNMLEDKPWSQYYCCIAFGRRSFVRDNPVATKRYLRAIHKAAQFCAVEPELAARQLVEAGFAGRFDYALQTLNEIPYARWREFDAEDSLRFYALRLHEVGMVTANPKAILAEGTDWRFVEELERELKT